MNIVVLAGSPKGEQSVTVQSVRYLQSTFPGHGWSVEHLGPRIRKIESDPAELGRILALVREADLVLWAFPVYFLLVPAGYQRFLELVQGSEAFRGKYAASLSTSIHFHDDIAHVYLREVSEDLGMAFVGSFSAAMDDLMKPRGRAQLAVFGRGLVSAVEGRVRFPRRSAPVWTDTFVYRGPARGTLGAPAEGAPRVALVTDGAEEGNARAMADRLALTLGAGVRRFDLGALDLKGNCLGCLRCAADNVCAYDGKDGFRSFFDGEVARADILVFVGRFQARHLSARWRRFFERGFAHTHQPQFAGKPLAFLVAGPVSATPSFQEFCSGYAQSQGAHLVDILSDEAGDQESLDAQVDGLAVRLLEAHRLQALRPQDFRGVGGRKVFRDDIFGPLRFVFLADHRYYTKNGYYDFPTRSWGMRVLNRVLGAFFLVRPVRKAFESKMLSSMILPHQAVLRRVTPPAS